MWEGIDKIILKNLFWDWEIVHYFLGRIWKRNTAVKANSPVGMILLEEEEKEDQGLRRTKKINS